VPTPATSIRRARAERDEIRKDIAFLESAVHSEDQTLELLRMQQDAAASRNADLAEKEEQEASRERHDRETYVRQLFDQASAANDRQRALIEMTESDHAELQLEVIRVLDQLGETSRQLLVHMEDHDGVARKLALDDDDPEHPPATDATSTAVVPPTRCALLCKFAEHHMDKATAIITLYEHLKQLVHLPSPAPGSWARE
jgi:FtsZ-binding cell division protein ZapB